MFDLEAYFARIGYAGSRAPTLATLHALTAAHTQTIPFENLDVLLGRPIELGAEVVFDKLVRRGRGGYCFEQNGLFLQVLEAMGFRVQDRKSVV
jgi:arylamine N-acetyltransferase